MAGALGTLSDLTVDDLLDLAAVDVEVSSYRSLAPAFGAPGSYRLLQRRHRGRFDLVCGSRGAVQSGVGTVGTCSLVSPDKQHEKFERPD